MVFPGGLRPHRGLHPQKRASHSDFPHQKQDYFSSELINEIGKLLKSRHQKGALRFLKQLAQHDLNRVLMAYEAIGENIGKVLGLDEKQSVDFKVMKRNKNRYGTGNLFTAWAIGEKESIW